MLRKALRAAFAVLATFLSLPAADFHVLPAGNDANPGPAPRPLRALAAARDRLRPWLAAKTADGENRGTNHHLCHCERLVGQGRGVFLHSAAANQVSHRLAKHVPRCGICGHGAPYVASTQNNPPCDSVLSFCNTHRVNQDARDAGSVFFHAPGKRLPTVGGKP